MCVFHMRSKANANTCGCLYMCVQLRFTFQIPYFGWCDVTSSHTSSGCTMESQNAEVEGASHTVSFR